MPDEITTEALVSWCRIPHDRLADHPGRRTPLRLVADSASLEYNP